MANEKLTDLEHLFASLLLMGFKGNTLDESPAATWLEAGLGGMILFDLDYLHYLKSQKLKLNNIETPDQVVHLTAQIKARKRSAFIGVDVEGGVGKVTAGPEKGQIKGVTRLQPKYGFAETLSAQEMGQRYQAGKIDEVRKNCQKIAAMLQAHGFNLVFAPVVDVNTNPNCPIIGKMGRSFSSDPDVVVGCAKLFIEACTNKSIQCVLKHYPGHGSATGDSHLGLTDVTTTWAEDELRPYASLAKACGMVMTSHVIHQKYDDKPASISPVWVKKLRESGFEGVIVTDDVQMDGLLNFIKLPNGVEKTDAAILNYTVLAALQAGSDMITIGSQLKPFDKNGFEKVVTFLQDRVNAGELSLDQVKTSYARVCDLKRKLGIE